MKENRLCESYYFYLKKKKQNKLYLTKEKARELKLYISLC